MKFSCKRDTLATYLNIVNRIIVSKPGLPILNNVLIQAEKGKLFLRATDLELGMNCWIGAKVDSDGVITVPSGVLTEYINGLNSENIDAELKDTVISFSTSNNTANFNTMPSDDYPTFATVSDDHRSLIKISRDDLLDAVNKVSFAVDSDGKNPIYTGIKVEIEDDTMSFVATDTLRLSRYSIKLSKKVKESLEFIVPAKAFDEIAHVVATMDLVDGNDFVELFLIEEKNQILFRYNDIDLLSRLIDGEYADYKSIIPTAYTTKVNFDREELINSLKLINVMVKRMKVSRVDMNIDVKNSTAVLKSSNVDLGSNESILKVDAEGKDMGIMFNSKHIIDLLTRLDAERVLFELTANNAPVMVRIEGDENFLHLMMPITLV